MLVLKLTFLLLTMQSVVFAGPIDVDEQKLKHQQQRKNERYNACKLVFENVRKTHTTQLQERENKRVEETICNLVFGLQPAPEVPHSPITIIPIIPNTSSTQRTPVKAKQHVIVVDDGSNNKEDEEEEGEKKDHDPTKPLYEQQLTVWPSDIDDLGDTDDTEVPVIAEQELWYPDEHEHEHHHHHEKIKVVESFHLIYPDGTSEYKLVLSNGMMDYKKIYTKKVGKEKFIIQEGYYTVPVRGKKNKFKIQYYKADEHGYHVHE